MIEPEFYYFLHFASSARLIAFMIGFLMIAIGFCSAIDNKDKKMLKLVAIGAIIICIVMLTPNKDTLILMKATKIANGSNPIYFFKEIKSTISQASLVL